MTLRTHGDPILKQRAETIPPGVDVGDLVRYMQFTLRLHDGLGLSAQQAGRTERIALAKFYGETTVLINLEIIDRSQETILSKDEGCLSVHNAEGIFYRTDVIRHRWVIISYEDEHRRTVTRRCEGLDAIIAQHEYDHLEGKCIADGATREDRKASYRAQRKARTR